MARILGGLVCVCFTAVAFLQSCAAHRQKDDTPVPMAVDSCRDSNKIPDPSAPQLDCAAPPNTFDTQAFFAPNASRDVQAQAGPAFDSWAWASFAALNWPAQEAPASDIGYLRGIPDLSLGSSFKNARSDDVLVWETFKEKREVFNSVVEAGEWQELTFPLDQTINLEGGQVQACTTEDDHALKLLKKAGSGHRRILQASKLAPAFGLGPHALDETAEVASPAQEAQNALCAGYEGEDLADCQKLFPPPPDGDGDTPYGPTTVNDRPALGVGPRVYDPNGTLVFYEVRVNYDYFAYVLQNRLNFRNASQAVPPPAPLVSPPYKLPWRTSASSKPPSDTNKASAKQVSLLFDTTGYSAGDTVDVYRTQPATPPPVGSVQVKSAWRLLRVHRQSELPLDPQYHTSDAVYFMTRKGVPGNVCYAVGTFGLIGLHIIQRVHMGDSSEGQAAGGTFIFATWEHTSIGNGGGYTYVNFLAKGGADQDDLIPYPRGKNNVLLVNRKHAYPLDSTSSVNQAVHKQLPNGSVWKNYRLIGTQFYANVTSTTSLNYNQPYYLANLVVETNDGLQSFRGLPPNLPTKLPPKVPTYYRKGFKTTGMEYEPNYNNVAFQNNVSFQSKAYNMGGCMGCHGVAQILGSSFSFVLLDGQKGAGIDTTTHVSIPP